MNQMNLATDDYQKMIGLRNKQTGYIKYLGLKTTHISEGRATVELSADDPNYLNPTGVSIHGGCIFSLADSAGGAAAWSRGYHVATSSSHINYLNPAINIKKLIANAKEIKAGKRLIVEEIEISDDRETLIAKATMTYVPLNRPVLE